jgi:hypothetical protein
MVSSAASDVYKRQSLGSFHLRFGPDKIFF